MECNRGTNKGGENKGRELHFRGRRGAEGKRSRTELVMDLSYLQSGYAVNKMDYNWQQQALTCFTEIRRNRGKNSMRTVCWIPSAPGSDSLLAIGGTDGELEIFDLTDSRVYIKLKRNVNTIELINCSNFI